MKTILVCIIIAFSAVGCISLTCPQPETYLVECVVVQGSDGQCRNVMNDFQTNSLAKLFSKFEGKLTKIVSFPTVEVSIGESKTVSNYYAFIKSPSEIVSGTVKTFSQEGLGESITVFLEKTEKGVLSGSLSVTHRDPPKEWREHKVGSRLIYTPDFHLLNCSSSTIRLHQSSVFHFGGMVDSSTGKVTMFLVKATKQ